MTSLTFYMGSSEFMVYEMELQRGRNDPGTLSIWNSSIEPNWEQSSLLLRGMGGKDNIYYFVV